MRSARIHDSHHDDFGGLHRDLMATGAEMNRRGWLRLAARAGAGVGALQLFGCGGSPVSPTTLSAGGGTSTATTSTGSTTACTARVPEETAGPFPGNGTNGPNVLTQAGVVRSDLRSSFGGLSGTADGVGLTTALTIVSASTCQPLAGHAIYLWHCDRLGRYSLYSSGATTQNYLRGVQQMDSNGQVAFTTIFPGCYSGRWPHIHFEVYPTLAAAASASNKVATSQIALPKTACDLVYATTGYESSVANLSQVTLGTDNIFSDGSSLELATVTVSVAGGLIATLTIAI